MAAYAQKAEKDLWKYGDQGDTVKKIQTALNNRGYNLDVDGIFGDETKKAVMKYQNENKLAVDGIVGNNTWNSLFNGLSSSTPSASTNNGFNYDPFSYDKTFTDEGFSYDPYKESQGVTDAKNALDTQLSNKPGEYTSQWQSQLDDVMNKILNREKFSYDLNGDALYQQYKDKYIKQGKMAMGDAIGQASAMTGGYGNSYAQSVGQQAYQAQLENLNDIVPELYQMAYDKYNQEGQDMYNQYGLLTDRENTDYGRYRDSVSDWMAERDYLAGRYDSERNFDYSKYADDRNFEYGKYSDDRTLAYNQFVDDRNFAYGKYADDKSYAYNEYRNAIADEQWQKEFDEAQRQFNEQMAFSKQQYNDSKASYSSGGSSSGGSYSGGSSSRGSSSGGSGSGSTGNESTKSRAYDTVAQNAQNYTSSAAQKEYLTSEANKGTITMDEAAEIMADYEYVDLTNRSWQMVDDGGWNWFGAGIDADAKVKDQYGNEYTLSELRKELKKTMTNKEANAWIKQLEEKLGI